MTTMIHHVPKFLSHATVGVLRRNVGWYHTPHCHNVEPQLNAIVNNISSRQLLSLKN